MKIRHSLKPIAGAVLLAASVGAQANPEVSFYGVLDLWVGSAELPAATDSTLQMASGGMTTSYVGTGLKYKISDSLRAIAALEMYLRMDTGEAARYSSDEFFGRNAFVGFEGDFGQIKAGRNVSPYFMSYVFTNPLGSSMAFSPIFLHTYAAGSGGAIMGDSVWSNSIIYNSPRKNGFATSVAYAFGERPGDAGESKVGGNINWRSGKWVVVAGAHDVQEGATLSGPQTPTSGERGALGGLNQTAAMFGTSYDFGSFRLFGQYSYMDTEVVAGDVEINTWHVGASIPVGKGNSIMTSYVSSEYEGAMDRDRETFSVAYNHQLNRQVGVYGAVVYDDVSDQGTGQTYGVGARFQF